MVEPEVDVVLGLEGAGGGFEVLDRSGVLGVVEGPVSRLSEGDGVGEHLAELLGGGVDVQGVHTDAPPAGAVIHRRVGQHMLLGGVRDAHHPLPLWWIGESVHHRAHVVPGGEVHVRRGEDRFGVAGRQHLVFAGEDGVRADLVVAFSGARPRARFTHPVRLGAQVSGVGEALSFEPLLRRGCGLALAGAHRTGSRGVSHTQRGPVRAPGQLPHHHRRCRITHAFTSIDR